MLYLQVTLPKKVSDGCFSWRKRFLRPAFSDYAYFLFFLGLFSVRGEVSTECSTSKLHYLRRSRMDDGFCIARWIPVNKFHDLCFYTDVLIVLHGTGPGS
jgi:hypothetical protein